MNDDYIIETKISDLLNNIVKEIKKVNGVEDARIYDGEIAGDLSRLKINITSGKATVLVNFIRTDFVDSETHSGEDALATFDLVIISGNGNKSYNPGDKNSSLVCLEAAENIQKMVGNTFFNLPLPINPSIESNYQFGNAMLDEKNLKIFISRLNVTLTASNRNY